MIMTIGVDPWSKIRFLSKVESESPIQKDEFRFLLATEASIYVVYDDKNIELKQGDFLLINAHKSFLVKNHDSDMFISIYLDDFEFNGEYFENGISSRVEGCSAINKSTEDEQLIECFYNIIDIRLHPEKYISADLLQSYNQIIALLFHHYLVRDEEQAPQQNNVPKNAIEAKRYIDRHYQKPITLDYVASHFYISSPYLSRLFKNVYHISFHQYITNLRLNSALREMMNTGNTLTDIALNNGFPNVGAFTKVFKKVYSQTPGAFRKNGRSTNGANQPIEDSYHPQKEMNQFINSIELQHEKTQKIVFSNIFQNIKNQPELSQSWRQIINLGPAKGILTHSLEQQIEQSQSDINFVYGRLFALFTDEMLMVANNGQNFSFAKIDDVLEVLIQNGLIPFIELGAKPLTVNVTASQRLKTEDLYHFISNQEFSIQEFYQKFIRHCISKWGVKRVSKWYFEVWYPSPSVMQNAKLNAEGNRPYISQFVKNFAAVYRAVKALLPEAQVGGCGLSADLDYNNLDLILESWDKETLPDFFSVYLYAQEFDNSNMTIDVKNNISSNPDQLLKMIRDIKTKLLRHNLRHIPLLVTEWNISVSDRNFVNDSLFKAAYIIKNVLTCGPEVKMFGYWQLSDNSGTYSDSNEILHGGTGILTKDSIKKPAYYAFKMLSNFTGNLLRSREDVTICSHGYERLNVLIYNYKHFNSIYYLNTENGIDPENVNSIFENTAPYNGEIEIEGIIPGRYLIKKWEINPRYGDILNRWLRWGRISELGGEDIRYLQANNAPSLDIHFVDITDRLKLSFNLEANSSCLFEIYRAS
ncbi:GH39 family glycosyl hydrolase [Lactiplantibacillus pentosus]|nr:helix-turn-helix domain-containing protein [Lactiplantibacillus pentosus]